MIIKHMHTNTVKTSWLGTKSYQETWDAMKQFTDNRDADTPDEIWFLEHAPVFTQGQSGKAEHILNAGNIPVVQTDRGGQVTYHGPGQLMAYTLIDLRRKKMNIRELVSKLEQTVIDYLASQKIEASARADAPGVYVESRKICSIGLRVRRGCAFHGIAFNINMDLSPFSQINPCGYSDLKMTQLAELGGTDNVRQASEEITPYLVANLGYTGAENK